MGLLESFANPPREFTLAPFWFLNDDLEEAELKRQLDDFAAHGVYGVVPHARMGLPERLAWMSDEWMAMLTVIVEHCAAHGMQVILYDEGMYPSGSCAGRVVAANPRHAARCIVRRREASLGEDEELVAESDGWYYIHTRSMGHIRGVHFGTDDGQPNAPAAGDILNPEAVASFLHLTHDRHFEFLGPHFGKTITAIFTDEPSMMGRGAVRDARPWTRGFAGFLQETLGYDFLPHLAALWDDDHPDAEQYRADFERAADARLDSAYYQPYSQWCLDHGVALTGHPAGPMDIGVMRHFQIPGQDVVWRYLEPFKEKSIEGDQSTMGKSSASAQVHYGRRRNLNECFGAYGWEFSYEEMRWLANWLLVRGVNLLAPHAFYYSVRGPRRDERPPDVGPNNRWWPEYKVFADYCRRICWLLAEGRQVCDVAILGSPTFLPWRAARVLFEHQWDFNYLDTHVLREAEVTSEGISICGMHYRFLLIDGSEAVTPEILGLLRPCIDAGRVAAYADPIPGVPVLAATSEQLAETLGACLTPDVVLDPPAADARYHHVRHGGADCYFFTNEGPAPIDSALTTGAGGTRQWLDPETGAPDPDADAARLCLAPYRSAVLMIS